MIKINYFSLNILMTTKSKKVLDYVVNGVPDINYFNDYAMTDPYTDLFMVVIRSGKHVYKDGIRAPHFKQLDVNNRILALFNKFKHLIDKNKLNDYFIDALRTQNTPLIIWLAKMNPTHKCFVKKYIEEVKKCKEQNCIQKAIDNIFLTVEKEVNKQVLNNNISEENRICIILLLKIGISPNIINDSRIVARASKSGYIKIVKLLVENGLSIDNRNQSLSDASEFGHLDIVKYLKENGADVGHWNNRAIQQASKEGYLDIVKYLVEHGADVRVDNDTPLEWASFNGHLDVVKFLVENGAQSNKVIELASKRGHRDVVEYLRQNEKKKGLWNRFKSWF